MEKKVFISLSIEDFKQTQRELFEELIKETLQQHKFRLPEEYLTRQQTADILKVSLPTLDSLTRAKGLKRHQVGETFRYIRSEVDKAMDKGLQHQEDWGVPQPLSLWKRICNLFKKGKL